MKEEDILNRNQRKKLRDILIVLIHIIYSSLE